MKTSVERIDDLVEASIAAGAIPGAGVAVVNKDEVVHLKAYGWRDEEAKSPVVDGTAFPIGSTTKAMNAMLIGMLAEEDRLSWDTRAGSFFPELPGLAKSTLRSLVAMRTGVPRHDWLWLHTPASRAEIIARLSLLPCQAEAEGRFGYNNLTTLLAGCIAEMAGQSPWEVLICKRLFEPLGMSSSGFVTPVEAARSYCRTLTGTLRPMPLARHGDMAPAGTAIWSTLDDMARWVQFNLRQMNGDPRPLHASGTPSAISEIYRSQVQAGHDPAAPSSGSSYSLGWFIDDYRGVRRLSHTGLAYGFQTFVGLFPDDNVGVVCWVNFAGSRLASALGDELADLVLGLGSSEAVRLAVDRYETEFATARCAAGAVSAERIRAAAIEVDASSVAGRYANPAYGELSIRSVAGTLMLIRGSLEAELHLSPEGAWVVREHPLLEIHRDSPFRSPNGIKRCVAAGQASVLIRFEPAIPPIRFDQF